MNGAASLFGCLWCVHFKPDAVAQAIIFEPVNEQRGTCTHPAQFPARVGTFLPPCLFYEPIYTPAVAPPEETPGPVIKKPDWLLLLW